MSGKYNPVDCASHGLYPNQLANHLEGWQGPEWLKQPENQWPMSSYKPVYDSGEERNADSNRLVLLTNVEVTRYHCYSAYQVIPALFE